MKKILGLSTLALAGVLAFTGCNANNSNNEDTTQQDVQNTVAGKYSIAGTNIVVNESGVITSAVDASTGESVSREDIANYTIMSADGFLYWCYNGFPMHTVEKTDQKNGEYIVLERTLGPLELGTYTEEDYYEEPGQRTLNLFKIGDKNYFTLSGSIFSHYFNYAGECEFTDNGLLLHLNQTDSVTVEISNSYRLFDLEAGGTSSFSYVNKDFYDDKSDTKLKIDANGNLHITKLHSVDVDITLASTQYDLYTLSTDKYNLSTRAIQIVKLVKFTIGNEHYAFSFMPIYFDNYDTGDLVKLTYPDFDNWPNYLTYGSTIIELKSDNYFVSSYGDHPNFD